MPSANEDSTFLNFRTEVHLEQWRKSDIVESQVIITTASSPLPKSSAFAWCDVTPHRKFSAKIPNPPSTPRPVFDRSSPGRTERIPPQKSTFLAPFS
ncbi:hypothetical protein CDAR_218021 [Caerostris darwini]|uniref:Uncharacterized protein n=1 Tax=Caerostris darwini TaxID=1538125 RepID=A0AAV4TFS1_9ARAC|nr:hypothetical protein CDAR_218021 [Caerostris darwini]